MGRSKNLYMSPRHAEILHLYVDTSLTQREIGDMLGISKQAVNEALKRCKLEYGYDTLQGAVFSGVHRIDRCKTCKKIIEISKNGELISSANLAKQVGTLRRICSYHVSILRAGGFVRSDFATFRSERLVKAYTYWRTTGENLREVGKKFGYKNLYSIFSKKGGKYSSKIHIKKMQRFFESHEEAQMQ